MLNSVEVGWNRKTVYLIWIFYTLNKKWNFFENMLNCLDGIVLKLHTTIGKLNSTGIYDFSNFLFKIAIFVPGGAAHVCSAQQVWTKSPREAFSSDLKGKKVIE